MRLLVFSVGLSFCAGAFASWWNSARWASRVRGNINGVPIVSELGAIQNYRVDAVFCPLFQGGGRDGLSFVIETLGGNKKAFKTFDRMLKHQGGLPAKLGTVQIHQSDGTARHVIFVVVLGSQMQDEFRLIRDAVYKGLFKASIMSSVRTIVIPAMGTGVSGDLTVEQAANAILAGIGMATANGAKFDKIILPVNREDSMLGAYRHSLNGKEYEAYYPGAARSPELGQIHYDWTNATAFSSSRIALKNLGQLENVVVRYAPPDLFGSSVGVRSAYLQEVDGLAAAGEVERISKHFLARRQTAVKGYREKPTIVFEDGDLKDDAGAKIEDLVYELAQAAEDRGYRFLTFSLGTEFLGSSTDTVEEQKNIASGFMRAIHRMKEDGMSFGSIDVAIDPALENRLWMALAFKSVMDEYAVANLGLYSEDLEYYPQLLTCAKLLSYSGN